MAQAEDKDPPEDEMSSSKEITLMKKYWGFSPKALESVPRTKTSSVELGQGLEKWIYSKNGNP